MLFSRSIYNRFTAGIKTAWVKEISISWLQTFVNNESVRKFMSKNTRIILKIPITIKFRWLNKGLQWITWMWRCSWPILDLNFLNNQGESSLDLKDWLYARPQLKWKFSYRPLKIYWPGHGLFWQTRSQNPFSKGASTLMWVEVQVDLIVGKADV